MTDQPLKPFIIAMTFGNQPHQQTVVDAIMAPNDVAAVAIAVSKAHTIRGIAVLLDGMCIAELTEDFVTAAHRGTAEPAPVLSLVPVPIRQKVSEDHPCARCNAPAGGNHFDHCPDLYVPPEQQPTPEEWAARFPPDGAA